MVGLKMVTYAKISPEMVNPRDLAGENTEEEEKEENDVHVNQKYEKSPYHN